MTRRLASSTARDVLIEGARPERCRKLDNPETQEDLEANLYCRTMQWSDRGSRNGALLYVHQRARAMRQRRGRPPRLSGA